MLRGYRAIILGVAVLTASAADSARAQGLIRMGTYYGAGSYFGNPALYEGRGYYAPPGLYGTSWGFPGFGLPRTYTAYSSPYGGGYGYGYPPASFLPSRYGVGLWRPGYSVPGYSYGAAYYGSFPVPYQYGGYNGGPAFGYYAPMIGPPSFWSW